MPNCVHCDRVITADDEVCPHCGGEQPVEWMVKLVYVLAFLFVQGVVYRLLWPEAASLSTYAVYFVLTGGVALGVWYFLSRRSQSLQ